MNDFYIYEMYENEFVALIVINSLDSPLTLLNNLQELLNAKNIKGKVLIDQLLHSGNTSERYISINFQDNQLKVSYVNVPKHSEYRNLSRDILCNNNLIEYSILTSVQKKMLLKGIAI